MSAPVSALAWLDSLHATTADGAITNHKWPEAQEARAAVVELVEASDPFAALNSSDAFVSIRVSTEQIARLRAAIALVGSP